MSGLNPFDIIKQAFSTIINAFVRILESVITAIVEILGYRDQVVEFFEVHNIALFSDPDSKKQLANIAVKAVITDSDVTRDILYALNHRSLTANLNRFVAYIEDGNYFEDFPVVESHILIADYPGVATVLTGIYGPLAVEYVRVGDVPRNMWIGSYLAAYSNYSEETNLFNILETEVTAPLDPMPPEYDEGGGPWVPPPAAVGPWYLDYANTYLSGSVYIVALLNGDDDPAELNMTVPVLDDTKVYVSAFYYLDADPTTVRSFIYEAGSGTYPDLDNITAAIEIDAEILQTMPAIPLRINNVNYTDFAAAKTTQIEELAFLVDLDAAQLLDEVLNDAGLNIAEGDLDHVYINFGVKVWDFSQAGLTYLYQMMELMYPAQAVTKGIYDSAPTVTVIPAINNREQEYGETYEPLAKPVNNFIVTNTDYKGVFQWNYITYEYTTLGVINSDSGSVVNGMYYSDMSKFTSGLLTSPYYVSSGKGTYNVGYKADNLAEVAAFVAGNGVVNPGDTSAEAATWLQVTKRMRYLLPLRNPAGNVMTETYLYLTPDSAYTVSGGNLQYVSIAAEETLIGQSMTYYYCDAAGIGAYTLVAPIAALTVIDGESGVFKLVKFNMGDRDELMIPMLYNFVSDMPNQELTQLFLAGAHVSVYLAHYEVIELSFWAKLLLVVAVVIAIVVIVVTWGSTTGPVMTALSAIAAGTATTAILATAALSIIKSFVLQKIIELIIIEVAESSPELALILSAVAAVGFALYGPGSTGQIDMMAVANFAGIGMDTTAGFVNLKAGELGKKLTAEEAENERLLEFTREVEGKLADLIDTALDPLALAILEPTPFQPLVAIDPEANLTMAVTGRVESLFLAHSISATLDLQVDPNSSLI